MAPLYFLVGCVLATILAYIFEIHCMRWRRILFTAFVHVGSHHGTPSKANVITDLSFQRDSLQDVFEI